MDKLMRRFYVGVLVLSVSCGTRPDTSENKEEDPTKDTAAYPSAVIPLAGWDITLGNGKVVEALDGFSHDNFFYTVNDGEDWVVFKSPNRGVTTKNSHNTRSELKQEGADEKGEDQPGDIRWTPSKGGKLTGTLKVMNVSTSGDPRVAAAYSVVVGQIHSGEGHKNEPLKIFYKKYPGHTKGSVFWNYEINTEGSNAARWDLATAVWGYDWSVLGTSSETYPDEPTDGIALGEEFSYEINVHDGIMYLRFESDGHETRTFVKSLVDSEFTDRASLPDQIEQLFVPIGREGVEKADAYKGEKQFFAQGAYNQANGDDPDNNRVWSTGSETFNGDIQQQYANGSYAEVWFKKSSVGPGTAPE